ncbi:extracellular solute-binding protein [Clostridiales bacterium COT073_COT-073]|nr:extracellular solute-binding protein [Clostridiales bacterium COT073_COT-073]
MKKIITLCLILVLTIVNLSSCGPKTANQPTDTNKQSTQTENKQTEASQPADKAKTDADNKLVVAIQTNSFVTDYDNNYFTKYLEEKLGMDIEFYQLPSAQDEVKTKLSLMVTSNDNLPDVLIVSKVLTPETILQYGNSGVFMDLTEYTKDKSKMPNYNAIPAEDKNIMDATQTMANGKMYSLSKFEPETWNLTPNRLFINRAWLEKLGLSIPKTTDELKTVLKAFHEKDPNGNGIQDEIGVYGFQSGGYGQNITATLMNAFEFWNGGSLNGGLALSEDGKKVIAPFATDNFKAGLAYMNDLYKEGLLSPEIFTADGTQFKATLNSEANIVGLTSIGSLSNYPDASKNKNFLEMEMIEPLTGPNGLSYTPYSDYSPSQELFVFSNCKNVDLAIRFADEFYDPYTSIITRFGEEEVDWTKDPAKISSMTNAYVVDGIYDKVTMAVISNFWPEPSAQTWHNFGPRYASLEAANTVANGLKPFDPEDKTQLVAKNYKYYFTKHPQHILPLLHYTEEQVEKIEEALANIPTYVNQSMAEFITGARSIDKEWDKYLDDLKGMGLEEWVNTAQEAFNNGK